MKILVGMSGGVDSSVTAMLLKQAGHEVIGATMAVGANDAELYNFSGHGCFAPNPQDAKDAKKICDTLGIKHYLLDCREQYRKTVIANFKSEYLSGRTPNPCVVCNSDIKFNVLPETARQMGVEFDKFATGHYARLRFNEQTSMYQIGCGIAPHKDQSYFLYRLSQTQLSKIMLPLGEKTKEEIRAIAHKNGLIVADKPDSQDFYNGNLNDILQFAPKQGNFVDQSGNVLGTHQGYWNFTIGQRRGLGISAAHPLYVIDIIKARNEVVVGFADECLATSLEASSFVWQIPTPCDTISCLAKIRSAQNPFPVEVTPLSDNTYSIKFDTPQSAVTPGQSVVLYQDDFILGGGIIEK